MIFDFLNENNNKFFSSIDNSENLIGVYSEDEKHFKHSYVLYRTDGNTTIIIQCKSIMNKTEFDEEVKNLSKYFNAKIIRTK